MKVKFNKYERVAGLFVMTALIGSLAIAIGVAVKKGWFASKVQYQTMLDTASGIHSGTAVQMEGLRIGSVTDVDLVSHRQVQVRLEVFKKFQRRIREDSRVQVIRPFLIGEKVIDITVGDDDQPIARSGSTIASKPTFDIMDVFSGRTLGPFADTLDGLTTNLKVLAQAFSDKKRMRSFVKIFDRLEPLVQHLNKMSIGVARLTDVATQKQRMETILNNLAALTKVMNKALPELATQLPAMGQQIPQLVANLTELTEQFKKLTPAITAVAPQLPDASRKAIEALNEAVITMKAIQNTWLIRSQAEKVRKEEAAKQAHEKERLPASASPPPSKGDAQ